MNPLLTTISSRCTDPRDDRDRAEVRFAAARRRMASASSSQAIPRADATSGEATTHPDRRRPGTCSARRKHVTTPGGFSPQPLRAQAPTRLRASSPKWHLQRAAKWFPVCLRPLSGVQEMPHGCEGEAHDPNSTPHPAHLLSHAGSRSSSRRDILSRRAGRGGRLSKGFLCRRSRIARSSHPDACGRRMRRTPERRRRADILLDAAWTSAELRAGELQKRHGRDAIAFYFGNPVVHNHGGRAGPRAVS